MQRFHFPKWLIWLSVVVLLLDVLLFIAIESLTGRSFDHSGTIIYPLFLHRYSGTYPKELLIGIPAWIVLLLVALSNVFTVGRPLRTAMITLSFLIVLFCVFITVFAATIMLGVPRDIPQLSTVQFQGNQYHLILDRCYEYDSGCFTKAYLVLKCDRAGIVCNRFNVPFREETVNSSPKNSAFYTENSGTALYVRIGTTTFPVVVGS